MEAAGQAVAGDEGGRGGTECHQAAGRLCWPAVCYLLQPWLGSQHGVCKVGQNIIYLPPLLPPSFAPSLGHYLTLLIMQPFY